MRKTDCFSFWFFSLFFVKFSFWFACCSRGLWRYILFYWDLCVCVCLYVCVFVLLDDLPNGHQFTWPLCRPKPRNGKAICWNKMSSNNNERLRMGENGTKRSTNNQNEQQQKKKEKKKRIWKQENEIRSFVLGIWVDKTIGHRAIVYENLCILCGQDLFCVCVSERVSGGAEVWLWVFFFIELLLDHKFQPNERSRRKIAWKRQKIRAGNIEWEIWNGWNTSNFDVDMKNNNGQMVEWRRLSRAQQINRFG